MKARPTVVKPGPLLRLLYAATLLSFLPPAVALSSGWLGLITGGGPLGLLGSFAIAIAALLAFRAWQALWYRRTLEACNSRAGGLVRGAGIIAMAAGVLCVLGMFMVAPLTRVFLGGPGDANIGYLMMTLVLAAGAQFGWLGVVLFEIGRRIGPAMDPAEREPAPPAIRMAGGAIVVALAALLALPAIRLVGPRFGFHPDAPPCGLLDLADCVSTTEGSVTRFIGMPIGEPVALDSNVDVIVLDNTHGHDWRLVESIPLSVRVARRAAKTAADARVRVSIAAEAQGKGVALKLAVADGDGESARFVTTFPQARIETDIAGLRQVIVPLPGGLDPGSRPGFEHVGLKVASPDHVYNLVRRAIGDEIEAGEMPLRVEREARPSAPGARTPAEAPGWQLNIDPRCAGRVSGKVGRTPAPIAPMPLYVDLTFAAAGTGPHAHTMRGMVVCDGDAVWVIDYAEIRPSLMVRRYTLDGTLKRYVVTRLPLVEMADVVELPDPLSFEERGGRIHFARVVSRWNESRGAEEIVRADHFEVEP